MFIISEPYYHIGLPIALFAAIYLIYYILTVKLYQNIVLNARGKATR